MDPSPDAQTPVPEKSGGARKEAAFLSSRAAVPGAAIGVVTAAMIGVVLLILAASASQRRWRIAETILLYQRNNGGWPKNYDKTEYLSKEAKNKILSNKNQNDTTFDNYATYSEMRHLAQVYKESGDVRYKVAFLKGLDFTLAAQYANGGWPQFYPEATGYHVYITFNDDAMIGVMKLLKAIVQGDEAYAFVDKFRRERCNKAIEKGVQCILKCQIYVNGKKTAWCAQHDEKNFTPRKARSYELRSISGDESVGVVRYLMDIDDPDAEVKEAIQSAVAWFDEAKLTGIRQVRRRDNSTPRGSDKVVVNDPTAPPLWARFYEIGSNKPIFCSRDGIPRDTMAEISYERRNGYRWLGDRASKLLSRDYPAWQKRWDPNKNVLRKEE